MLKLGWQIRFRGEQVQKLNEARGEEVGVRERRTRVAKGGRAMKESSTISIWAKFPYQLAN